MAALILAAYLPALPGDFLSDDFDWIVQKGLLVAPDALRQIWVHPTTDQYQPLAYTSLWIDFHLWGAKPAGYLLENIGLHIVNSLLVWIILRRIGVRGAWLAALLFGIHPVNVESVAWIYERKNVLSGVFYLLTILALVRCDDRKSPAWYAVALGLFPLALLTKTSTAVLPAVMVLYLWWQGRSWRAKNACLVAPFVALALGMAAVTVLYEQQRTGAEGAAYASTAVERLARSGWMVWFYVSKLLIPTGLTFVYPRWSPDPHVLKTWLPHVAIIVVLAVLFFQRRSWGRPALLGLGYFLICLAPVLGFFDIYYHRYSFVADHFLYLASMGFIALVVHRVAFALRYGEPAESVPASPESVAAPPDGAPTPDQAATGAGSTPRIVGAVAAAVCLVLCLKHAALFRSGEALWTDTVQRNPESWIARCELGEYLLSRKPKSGPDDLRRDLQQAAGHLQKAVELAPSEAESVVPLVNLGAALNLGGQSDAAVTQLRLAAERAPDNPLCQEALGNVLVQRKEYAAAVECFQKLAGLRSDQAAAHYKLGFALCGAGRLESGAESLRRALQMGLDEKAAQNATLLVREAEKVLAGRAAEQPSAPLPPAAPPPGP
jgi:protein O-mannosyl-transferase